MRADYDSAVAVGHHEAMDRRWLIVAGAAALTGAAAWALALAGGGPAACVPTCDCEGIATGVIAQPANAWSALIISVAGVAVLALRAGRERWAAGTALILIGLSAWAAHATVTAWAYRAEGAVLAGAAWPVALAGSPPAAVAAGIAGAAAGWWLDAPWSLVVAGAGAAAAIVAHRKALRGPWAWGAGALLGAGLAGRALADDGAPWCRPEAWLPGHAAWHLIAAAGLGIAAALLSGKRDPDSPEPSLPSSPS